MVGLIKMTMYKIVGKSKLKRKELEKLFTDTETLLNNRLLAYIEDDVQFPVLNPDLLVLGHTPVILNEDLTDTENKDLRKR